MEYELDGWLDPKYASKVINVINKKFDVKYTVIKTYNDICHEISEAAKIGKLAHVIIDGHGNSDGMCISGGSSCDNWIHEGRDFLNCFSGLDVSGKIVLLSPKAGEPQEDDLKNNIAQKIATAAKRTVIAATEKMIQILNKPKILNLDDFEIYLSTNLLFEGKNVFKIFHPIYENCINIFKNKIHAREQLLLETIKDETLAKSYLNPSTEFEDLQDLLRLCDEDPRQKFLYLSMEADHNGALNPSSNPQLFEVLSKNYDFKYKVIKSYDELCSEIREAARSGELINIVINGHGNPGGIHISGENNWDNYISIYKKDLARCFKDADLSKITLFSCNVSAPLNGDVKNNFSNKLAEIKNEVKASPEYFYLNKVKLTSINPFEFTHPSQCDDKGRCKSDINAFQIIDKKKK